MNTSANCPLFKDINQINSTPTAGCDTILYLTVSSRRL